MPKIIDLQTAASLIQDGNTVLFGGSGGGVAVPEACIEALAERFRTTGAPRDLTVSSVVSIGDFESKGLSLLAHPGLVKRVITAGLNNPPKLAALALADQIEAYTLPQGILSMLMRDMAAGRPGLLTKTGLHTFVDPRYSGAKQSPSTREELVELVELHGEEYLLYRSFPVDVAIIRGTTADEKGNITFEDEAYAPESFSVAAAAHNHGGIVIAQVKRIAAAGSLHPKLVKVPGVVVDYIVVVPDAMMTYKTAYDPAYAGDMRRPDTAFEALPLDVRKVIARRAAMELYPGAVVNLGFGVSNGISAVAAEEGFYKEVTLTVEQGIIGGVPGIGMDGGTGVNAEAIIDQPYQFDFYDGGGLDIAFLSFAEVDANGSVNVSRYGHSITGPGGFINISQGARKVVFSGTLTTGGLSVEPDGVAGLRMTQEGRLHKWVSQLQQITFNGTYARQRGQEVMFVTERAVFRLGEEGMEVIEVAQGIDLQRDVLDQIDFPVRVSPFLRPMDPRLFKEEPMDLVPEFRAHQPLARTKRVK